jgi:hypothetical protein
MNRNARRQSSLLCSFFALLVVFLVPAARAQTGLYGGFNAAKVDYPSDKWVYGGMFGIYSDFMKLPGARVGGDLRFSVIRPDSNTNLFSTLVGPRVAFHPRGVPLTPYAEGLIGWGHYSFGNNIGGRTKFEYQVLAGADRPIVPHLDWRVAEFSYGALGTYTYHTNLHIKTLSTGLVLRF